MSLRRVLTVGTAVAVLSVLSVGLYSLRPPPQAQAQDAGALIIFYSQPDFQGRSLEVTASLLDLPVEIQDDGSVFNWNDNVRSIRVLQGTWRLYQHGRFNTELDETPVADLVVNSRPAAGGWSCLVSAASDGEVDCADGAQGGWAADVSSVEFVSASNLPDWALSLREIR